MTLSQPDCPESQKDYSIMDHDLMMWSFSGNDKFCTELGFISTDVHASYYRVVRGGWYALDMLRALVETAGLQTGQT